MSQIQYEFKKNDEYFTPDYAVTPIVKYLSPGATVWCPFDQENSNYVKVLRENGFNVVFGHIATGQDFFKVEVPDCDYVISNPPYSLKGPVFERLYEIGKPFAMLVNFQGIFDAKDRFEMFSREGVEMLWLSPRVEFSSPGNNRPSGVPFQSGYLCHGILPETLMFEKITRR